MIVFAIVPVTNVKPSTASMEQWLLDLVPKPVNDVGGVSRTIR